MDKILIALAICTTILFGKDGDVTQLFNIKTIAVESKHFGESKTYYGYTEASEQNIAFQTIRFDGYVQDIFANETYLYVKKGDRLFDIYSPELINAQNELINAIKFKSGIAQAYAKLRLLGVDKRVIEDIQNSGKAKEIITIYSDAEGFITEKKIQKGSFIQKGSNIYTITNYSPIWVIAKILQNDIKNLKEDSKATISIEGISEIFSTTLDKIYPFSNIEDKSIDARFVLPNSDLKIYPNMFARVEIYSDAKTRLILPKSAVLIRDKNHIVFKKSEYEGEFEPTIIKAKKLTNGDFEILEGVEEGEEVADNALFMLDSDAQINGLY